MDSFGRTELSSASFLDEEIFDTIVVGGGTAGLVVATRLTEDPGHRLLVIEAGADRRDDPRTQCPGLAPSTYFDPDFDWCFTSKPQAGINGRQIAEPRGRLLGGSSAINLGAMIYPSKSGFDAWEKLGNSGWGWDGISKYFRKFHTYHAPEEATRKQLNIDPNEGALHGTDGPIQSSYGGEGCYTPFNEAWGTTFKNLGYGITGNPISGISTGGYSNTGTIDPKTGQRSHAGAYLTDEVLKRPNLRILTETHVDKLILTKSDDDGSIIATGVHIALKDGTKRSVPCTTEVILAAGALKTPHLLELSGIGNSELLQKHNIPVMIDNPYVGENLQEHSLVSCSWEVLDPYTSGDMMREPAIAAAAMAAWQNGGKGPLSACAIANAFVPMHDFGGDELDNLLDKHLNDYAYKPHPAQAAQYALLREILHNPADASGQYELAPFQVSSDAGPHPGEVLGLHEPGCFVSIVSALNHPFSRGSVHLCSTDAAVIPEVDVGLFEHPLDVELQARHLLWAEKLAGTEPFAGLLKKGGRRLHGEGLLGGELEAAKEMVRQRGMGHFHVVGSAAMMPEELGGVVDSRLRVYGTRGLRIVDASVFPLVPRGNVQADVYAVAEKAADLIKEERAWAGT
ncbi:GMC oxidoreductase [Aplosporella prunicola CBS 121167]|uniref:GMC oxidoreductase n=1 Tax=Aplosporella prunicola CBS 121167 TaxID=1176127 RepID=A0A6A6BHD4_9PEZI|nr:GMC oxidoreductase [Aplosporella prunicola CBS 121167]KAF2141951.1 GMC oxidoreductase [Aplosporella prunicola CBS 121167]